MSVPITNITYAKRSSKGPSNGLKGCCCKRSQCIKNYCDCYQSMVICSNFCKCVGCRNTEERTIVNTTPVKTANKAKRDRAAALTAKAAAAAAKATNVAINPNGPPYMPYMQMPYGFMPQHEVNINMMPPMQLPTMTQMMQLPQSLPQFQPIASMPISTVGLTPGRPMHISSTPKQLKPVLQPPPEDHNNNNVFTQPINAALLECMLFQVSEAEKIGLDDMQISQLVLHEATRGFACMLNTLAAE